MVVIRRHDKRINCYYKPRICPSNVSPRYFKSAATKQFHVILKKEQLFLEFGFHAFFQDYYLVLL